MRWRRPGGAARGLAVMRPTRLYGEGGSHYQSQGLKLSKHFRVW